MNTTNPNSENESGTSEEEKVPPEVLNHRIKPTFNNYLNDLTTAYESEHPNIITQCRDYPFDAVQTKLLATAASNGAPDVVNLNTEIAVSTLSLLTEKHIRFSWYTSTQILFIKKKLVEQAGLDWIRLIRPKQEMNYMTGRV